MMKSEIERRFSRFRFERDVREPPDPRRRGQFLAGWRDAADRGRKYRVGVLRLLTWRNLGYRFGEAMGQRSRDERERVYSDLDEHFETRWVARSFEDRLLETYSARVKGRMYVEVPVGVSRKGCRWPKGSKRRRIDAVRIQEGASSRIHRWSDRSEPEFRAPQRVELIEIKEWLCRDVIGQVVAGREMFSKQYGAKAIRSVVLCRVSDPALKWVCDRLDIRVEIV